MKPRFNIGQRVTANGSKESGVIVSLVSDIKGPYVYRVRCPGGAVYSYAEHELATVQSTYYTGDVTPRQTGNSI